MVQNQRPITLRTALFKISTVLLKKRFMGALEAAGTVDAEQQGFRCRRSARRAVHALQNLIWDARRAKKKILLISLNWRSFFGSIGQDAFLAVAGMVGFYSEDVALIRAFYKDTSLFVRSDGGDSAQNYLSVDFFRVMSSARMTPHWWLRETPTVKFSRELRSCWIPLPNLLTLQRRR